MRQPISAVVDAVGGDPGHPEQPGLADGHGAFCQAAVTHHLPAAARSA